MVSHAPGTGGRDERPRAVHVLTSRALSLALDPTISVDGGSRELVRYSLGDVEVLLDTADHVMSIAEAHPGSDATRALEIVDGAISRTQSLRRHPASAAANRPVASERSVDITL